MAIFFQLSDLGLPTTRAEFLQIWLNAMQAQYPGYSPAAADPEYVQAQIFASWAADLAQLCTAGGTELFRQYLTKLIGLPFQQGTPAQAIVTITAADTAGYTLPTLTQLTLTLDGSQVAFETAAPLTIPNGSSTGQVTVIAVQPGTAFNGATGPAQLVSQINWVTGVTVVAPATNGVDLEDDDQYVQRGAGDMKLLAMRPINAADFAQMAINFTPAANSDQQLIGRATAIDGYNPVDNTYGNERMVAVCPTDGAGSAVNNDTMYGIGGSSVSVVTNPATWGLAGWLQSLREIGFLVNVVAPNYTPIYTAVTVKGTLGYAPATVKADVQAAVLAYLNPQNFGLPQGAISGWNNTPAIYLSRVEAAIQNVQSVDHIAAGTLAVDINPSPTNTTNDLVLPGPFPLPITNETTVPLSAITVI